MDSYKELKVWQQSMELTVAVYKVTATFPSDERFGLTSQIRRAASSVPANIAEGWGRGTSKDYVHFLYIARGSLMELETHLILANALNFLSKERLAELQVSIGTIVRMLNSLITSLRNRSTT